MTPPTLATLTARLVAAYDDERAAALSRRQAVIDSVRDAGRDPASQMTATERRMFDEYSARILDLGDDIDTLNRLVARRAG